MSIANAVRMSSTGKAATCSQCSLSQSRMSRDVDSAKKLSYSPKDRTKYASVWLHAWMMVPCMPDEGPAGLPVDSASQSVPMSVSALRPQANRIYLRAIFRVVVQLLYHQAGV
jgi:hypothetical protein